MSVPEWMNWDGWRWVASCLAMGVGIYIGWDARGVRARLEKQLADLKAGSAIAAVELLARQDDPFAKPLSLEAAEKELEAFAHHIRIAKNIVGDLSREARGGHEP